MMKKICTTPKLRKSFMCARSAAGQRAAFSRFANQQHYQAVLTPEQQTVINNINDQLDTNVFGLPRYAL